MGDVVTRDEAKKHLRVDHVLDDDSIDIYIGAAEAHVMRFLNIDEWPDTIPMPVKAGTLLVIGDLYENRAGQQDSQLYKNQTVENLLYPYRENMGI